MTLDPRSAFMEAYAPCHEPFSRYCTALSYGRMDAQDLMQDVLLSAFQRFERIRKKDELLHYLLRAARNRAISRWRKARHNEDITAVQAARLRERGASPELLTDAAILYHTLDKLPTAQRDALVLFEVSGLTMAEIAAVQGTTEGAVKTRVSRARTTLRTLLEGRARQVPAELLNTLTSFLL